MNKLRRAGYLEQAIVAIAVFVASVSVAIADAPPVFVTAPVSPWTPPVAHSVQDQGSSFLVSRETYSLTVSKSNATVTSATVIGTSLGPHQFPNLYIIDNLGDTFEQRLATGGTLSYGALSDHFRIYGSFQPRTASGRVGPTVSVDYRIRVRDGYFLVRYTISASASNPVTARKIWVAHKIGDIAQNDMTRVHYGIRLGKPYEHENDYLPLGTEGTFASDKMAFAMLSNGRIGFEVEPVKYSLPTFATAGGDNVVIYSQGDTRGIDFYLLNQPAGQEQTMISPLTIQENLSFLPYRIYKPIGVFMMGADGPSDGPTLAEMGITVKETFNPGYTQSITHKSMGACNH